MIENDVLEIIRTCTLELSLRVLLEKWRCEPNDKKSRMEIESLLSEIFDGIFFVRCNEIENTPDVIDRNEFKIKFVDISQNFVVTLTPSGDIFFEDAR